MLRNIKDVVIKRSTKLMTSVAKEKIYDVIKNDREKDFLIL